MMPATDTVHPGDTFTLDVVVDPEQFGLTAGDVQVYFDPALFEIQDIQPGSLLGSNTIMGIRTMDNTAGTAHIAVGRVGAIPASSIQTPKGTLATLSMKVRDDAALRGSSIYITSIGLADQSFENITGIQLDSSRVSVVAP